jgi:hypothetical protein
MARKKSNSRKLIPAPSDPLVVPAELLGDVRRLIETARSETAAAMNSGLVLLYWQIGTRIRSEVLQGSRAEYGKQILSTLSKESACRLRKRVFRPQPLADDAIR